MTGIIWLASYPKSGNTWLRFLLYNYLYKEARNADDVAKRIPDIHVRGTVFDTRQTEPLFCKTHFLLSERHPMLNETAGFIYVLRHPKDVLLSNLNYFRMISKSTHLDEQQFAREFITYMGVRKWMSMGMGTWPEHVNSWLSESRYPHIILRYETLLQDTHSNFRDVLEFLGVPIDQNRLNRAVHLSSFGKMRTLEDAEKKKGKYGPVFAGNHETAMTGLRFMNKGKAGQTLQHLGENLEQEFNEKFRDAMRTYGYE